MDEVTERIPTHLRFVKGVVDGHDLSLNVSREILQKDRQIQVIRKQLVKKVLGTLEDMKRDKPEDYLAFWAAFGPVLKEGAVVIIESTIAPGPVASLVTPALEQGSGRAEGAGFFVGRCPESVMTRRVPRSLPTMDRVLRAGTAAGPRGLVASARLSAGGGPRE